MKLALAISAAVVIAASAAFAGEKSAQSKAKGMDHEAMAAKMDAKMEDHFKAVDSNADGKITEQELLDFVTAKAKADFASMAGDDGAVTLDEMKAHHHAMRGEMMKENTAPEDGAMDHSEH